MTTRLHADRIWSTLTTATRQCRGQAVAAVPYFGKSGHRLLPLRAGDTLVVNAGKAAVASGQTSPEALRKLSRKRVRLFSCEHLHAKVFVFGRTAYVGSANVSAHSRDVLAEAIVETNDPVAVRDAIRFITGLCTTPIGTTELAKLDGIYREPRIHGGQRKTSRAARRSSPRVFLSQITQEELPPGFQSVSEEGESRAEALREHPDSVLDHFWHSGFSPFKRGDTVIQVVKVSNDSNTLWIYTPGVVTVRMARVCQGKKKTFVYLELPSLRRFRFETIKKRLGRGSRKRLERDGLLRDDDFRRRLQCALMSSQ
jgi:hypothetical protein